MVTLTLTLTLSLILTLILTITLTENSTHRNKSMLTPILLFLPFQWQSKVVDLVDPPLLHFYIQCSSIWIYYINTYAISADHH